MPGLLRLLLLTVFAWLASRLLLRFFRSLGQNGPNRTSVPPRDSAKPLSEKLVRDPVCGLALPESRAIRHGEHFFCSEACRDRHVTSEPVSQP